MCLDWHTTIARRRSPDYGCSPTCFPAGKEFWSAFTHEDTSHIPSLGPKTSSTITPIHVEVAGVQKLLSRLKPNKACGPDKVPNRVLKELAPVLAPPLTALYNKSLEEGTVPAEWRHALVTPVYKKGDKHSPSNYRPVSLTVVCCKLLEHIVCNHVLTHLEENNLLTTLQHGFGRGHSCGTQLLLTYNDHIRSFDKTLQTDMAILDFSRAFDNVPHRRLISKLTSYGVKGQVLTWIDSFLSDRKMTVVVDGHTAKESIGVLSGTPGRSPRPASILGLYQRHCGCRLYRHYNPFVRRRLFSVATTEEKQG